MIKLPTHAGHRLLSGLLVPLALYAVAMPSADAAPASPFVSAGGGVWNADGDPLIVEIWDTNVPGPAQVETGSAPDAFGTFRAAYGANGFSAEGAGGIDREVYGGSIWTDGFVVSGGSGNGLLAVSTRVHGSVVGHGSMDYALYVSNEPFDFQTIVDSVSANDAFWDLALPGATRVLYTAVANRCGVSFAIGDCGHAPFENFQGDLDVTLHGVVPFTYGSPLYVTSLFAGGLGAFGGSNQFLNSADFGITVPGGAALQTLSGVTYAAAVPEPSGIPMLAAGLGTTLLLFRLRARRGVPAVDR